MEIKVIGKKSHCKTKMIKNLKKALRRMNFFPNVKILDTHKIMKDYHNINMPLLVIDDKVVNNSTVLSDRQIKSFIELLA